MSAVAIARDRLARTALVGVVCALLASWWSPAAAACLLLGVAVIAWIRWVDESRSRDRLARTALVAVVCALLASWWSAAAAACFLLGVAVIAWIKWVDEGWLDRAIDTTLPALDLIKDGRRYRGANAEVIATKTMTFRASPFTVYTLRRHCVEQVCRSTSGEWFLLSYVVIGRPVPAELDVTPLSAQAAQAALEWAPFQYVKYFGEPTVV